MAWQRASGLWSTTYAQLTLVCVHYFRGHAASVIVTLFFCRHKPASTFFAQLVDTFYGRYK